MLTLHPGEQFAIVRQLPDPTDGGTYYVRATIRDAKLDTLIATVNLTDRGSRRFSGNYQIPQDPSGQGKWIAITTTVYTDSGYTTQSTTYAEEIATHLIQERYNPRTAPGVSVHEASGPDIDYKKIKKMIDESVSKIEMPKLTTEKLETMIAQVITKLSEEDDTDEKETEDDEKVDLSPVLDQIANVSKTIESLKQTIEELPQPEPIDYTNIDRAVQEIRAFASKMPNISTEKQAEYMRLIQESIDGLASLRIAIPQIKPDLDTIKKELSDFLYVVTTNQKPKDQAGQDRAMRIASRRLGTMMPEQPLPTSAPSPYVQK